jgi:spoIIIJ-associated protein
VEQQLSEIETSKLTSAIERVLGAITNFLEIELEYDYRVEEYEKEGGEKREIVRLNVSGNHDSLLIGYHGKTLNSIQDLVSTGLSTELQVVIRVVLDINSYRDKRETSLESLARRAEQQVLDSGMELEMEPMPSPERRVIHKILSEGGKVKTESKGEGRERRIVIKPLSK